MSSGTEYLLTDVEIYVCVGKSDRCAQRRMAIAHTPNCAFFQFNRNFSRIFRLFVLRTVKAQIIRTRDLPVNPETWNLSDRGSSTLRCYTWNLPDRRVSAALNYSRTPQTSRLLCPRQFRKTCRQVRWKFARRGR